MSLSRDFSKAIAAGDSKQVESMLSLGSVTFDANALIEAAAHGHTRIVELLFNHGARVDDVDSSGTTACHAAAKNGHVGVLELLVSRQANLAIQIADGLTALYLAIRYDHLHAVVFLIKAGSPLDSPTMVCMAAAMGTDVIQALIDRGIVMNALLTVDKETPCHYAASRLFSPPANTIAALRMLVQVCGIDLNARNRNGANCLHYAAYTDQRRVLRWLLAAGADVNVADNRGSTPLFSACARGRVENVLLLLAAGADVHTKNRDSDTPSLTSARLEDKTDAQSILHLLVASGANLDAKINRFRTAHETATARGLALPTDDEVACARRKIARAQLSIVSDRAFEVCTSLQSLGLDALSTCEILQNACGPLATTIPFHRWWQIATLVKHFIEIEKKHTNE